MQSSPPHAVVGARLGSQLQQGRYEVQAVLGEGGMAQVYQALDRATGRTLALKRLRPQTGEKQAAFAALFEREFLALSELKHPRIVEVFDYHVDGDGPYYTMELLEGGDLQRLAPVDYRSACALAYDICSALSLVHSRRMVFRDLSPNNVRRTADGLAKLIDFGALAPMGPSRDVVGTLPCVAPEAISFAPLDARTDVFALGATLYFALTRRHAYPGRNVEELTSVWNQPLNKPSELVGGVPAALDQLVLELLELDPERRPSSAGEVMARLSAIASLTPHEELLVKQSYLATPTMVGREQALQTVRAQLLRAKGQRGGSVCLQGVSGVGRSRMLEASGLEAKRLGMLVLRADARDAQQGDYGVVQALARSVLTQAPTLAKRLAEPHREQLARIIPELRLESCEQTPRASEPQDDLHEFHRHLQPTLRQWFCELAAQCPLMLAIDDLGGMDPPSAAFVGLLARDAQNNALFLLTGQTTGAPANPLLTEALQVYGRHTTLLPLHALDLEHTEQLLVSLFGDVPNLSSLAHHAHRITKGNPRDILRLSDHLILENLIAYQAGTWSIPDRLQIAALPASMAQALDQKIARLSTSALLLYCGLSCEPRWAFRFEECARLLSDAQPAVVMKALHELVAFEFVEQVGGAYTIAQSLAGSPLPHAIDPAALNTLYRNLATVCDGRQEAFRSARYLLRADDHEAGLRKLGEFVVDSVKKTDANPRAYDELLNNLPPDWLETFDLGLRLCDQLRRPAREKRAILLRFTGLAAMEGPRFRGVPYLLNLVDQLSSDAGLDCLADLPTTLDPLARIQMALGRAAARYRALPESERGSDPATAIAELTKTVVATMGTIAFTSSYSDWSRLPSLTPLFPLSPSLGVMQALSEGLGHRIGGRSEAAIALYRKVVERLEQPDLGGLPVSHHRHTYLRVMGGIGALEAAAGKSSSLEWAAKIASEPRFESMAMTVKQLYYMFQGDMRAAKRVKRQIEQARLESNTHYAPEAQHMFLELNASALAHDMTGLKRALDAVAAYETVNAEFKAAAHYGRCEYERMRGDNLKALAEVEASLSLMRAGQHLLWAYAASVHVRLLLKVGNVEQACAKGAEYLADADSLGYTRNHVRAALSLALVQKGDHAAATELADSAVEELRGAGVTGLHLAQVCEARARIAAAVDDQAGYELYAALYHKQWRSGGGRQLRERASTPSAEAEISSERDALDELRSTWSTCHSVAERLHAGLDLLARHVGALSGVLYAHTSRGLVRVASFGESVLDGHLDTWATTYFTREVTHYETADLTPAQPEAQSVQQSEPEPNKYRVALLGHHDGDASGERYALTGLVAFVGHGKRLRPADALLVELSRCVAKLDTHVARYL